LGPKNSGNPIQLKNDIAVKKIAVTLKKVRRKDYITTKENYGMPEREALTLRDDDPAVIAARKAEAGLFAYYGLQANDHYIAIPGQALKMRISEVGSGEPLLIVPGNTGDVFPLASLLAEIKGRRIIALNRPGGGLSEGMDHTKIAIRDFAVKTVVAAMDAFNLQKVDIVAHSMGAHWSLWTALDRPDRVRSLTLLGNPGNVMKGKPPLMLRMMMRPPFNRIVFKLLLHSGRDKKPVTLKAAGSSRETIDRLPTVFGEAYYSFMRLPHYFISLTSLLQNAAPPIDAQQLSGIRQRAQLLLGDKDTFASVATGQQIAAAMPDCTLNLIKDGSHLPWLEKPAECGRLINEFLATAG
jgi:2-hydroxy-6-oxonona-2,4-dienedioate hydrolase